MMILYLAGLKGVDPRCGSVLAGRRQRVADVQERHLPDLRPTNTVVLVVTIIEALRAFDLVFVFNKAPRAPSCCRSW